MLYLLSEDIKIYKLVLRVFAEWQVDILHAKGVALKY